MPPTSSKVTRPKAPRVTLNVEQKLDLIRKLESGRTVVRHEVEGGLERITRMALPALVTCQTGLNEPRYVSIRGIRKVSGMEIPALDAGDLELDGSEVGAAAAAVTVEEIFLPPRGEGAEMLEGSEETVVEQLVERLQREGAF